MESPALATVFGVKNHGFDVEYNLSDTNQSSLQRQQEIAVCVQDVIKKYQKDGPEILKNLNMTVRKGTIYTLLGSSGCGKTTLLSCILGIRQVNTGTVSVFGKKPGTKESGIPGKKVGYMPQEIALYNVFKIEEIIMYFGALYQMENTKLNTEVNSLISILDLPISSTKIDSLSGGQKRRVSLAISLIHSPELLVLDEPTVGVDPLLREKIWTYMKNLVANHQTTIIVTTHYVEESRQSNTVGLMRGGKIIIEKSPETLLQEHNTELLEDIVLKLCRNDSIGGVNENHINTELIQSPNSINAEKTKKRESYYEKFVHLKNNPDEISSSLQRIKSLMKKNLIVMTRNFLLIFFMTILPAIQVTLCCFSLGGDPKPIAMGVVNNELNLSCFQPNGDILRYIYTTVDDGCNIANLSCQLLSKFPSDSFNLMSYANEADAKKDVENGRIWGFMVFPEEYSENVYTRAASGNIADDSTFDNSEIYIALDESNKQIVYAIKKEIYDGYLEFVKDLLISCGFNTKLGEFPIKYRDPIYGNKDTHFKNYVAPSILIACIFFFPLVSSTIAFVWDKKQGTLERALIAGVKHFEVMTAFFITEGFIVLIQTAMAFFILSYIFKIYVLGSLSTAIFLTVLMGLTGVSLGFLIASFCNEEIEAIMLAMGAFFPNYILSGMLWPSLGMPLWLQHVIIFLPCTLACEALRSITTRGWGLMHYNVWSGFVSVIAWMIIFWTVTIQIHKILRRRR